MIAHHPRRSTVLAAVLGVAVALLAVPRPVAACDCSGPEAAIKVAGASPAEMVAFIGEAGQPTTQDPTPIAVTAWFGGPAPASVVGLHVESAAASSCGMTAPSGGAYLFATYRQPEGGLGLNLCSVAVRLDTEEGRRLLAFARETLGEPVPVTAQATAPPGAGSPAQAVGEVLVPLAVVLAFGLGLIGAMVGILRRRER